jgi:hypothetical protein
MLLAALPEPAAARASRASPAGWTTQISTSPLTT